MPISQKNTKKNAVGDSIKTKKRNKEPPAIPISNAPTPAVTLKPRKRCPPGTRKDKDDENKCRNPTTGEVFDLNESYLPESSPESSSTSVLKEIMEEEIMANAPPKYKEYPEIKSSISDGGNTVKNKKQIMKHQNNKEIEEAAEIKEHAKEYDYLYPSLNDPEFNAKIAMRKEFNDTQFDGGIYNIEKKANEMCNARFELAPHQLFVKNFLSMDTPYKSLLLYHGLGTGKTCSAIGIAEEMRKYMKNTGIKEKILIVASPTVQGNFYTQLFDENKLKQIPHPTQPDEFIWNIESCIGNSLLEEIDPTKFNKLSREKVITNIKMIIHTYYKFRGYAQLMNDMNEQLGNISDQYSEKEKLSIQKHKIMEYFSNRLIIIDEVHNLKDDSTDKNDGKNDSKSRSDFLLKIAQYAINLRLLLLSATPMYNSQDEIIWLTNLMNAVDKRPLIEKRAVFDKDGNFKPAHEKSAIHKYPESGEDLLRRKLTGYVSYVRGENPYTFPYRIYPSKNTFGANSSLESLKKYPRVQMNGKPIAKPLQHIRVYLNTLEQESPQYLVYKNIIKTAGEENETFEDMDKFGYNILKSPLESLNISYPMDDPEDNPLSYVGINGFKNTFKYVNKHQVDYHPHILKKYGRVLDQTNLHKYSTKISSICKSILNSEGIVIIYSQYLPSGILPIAIALEEMGFTRYCKNPEYKNLLYSSSQVQPLDATTMLPRSQVAGNEFQPARYIMITGEQALFSPTNDEDVEYAKLPENKDGAKVKVILISKAGSEGLDFKCVRQIHILEPWYNMSRFEQIIGRGVRNLSHCRLPFEKRNVQLFLHGTLLENSEEEAIDMYIYRSTEAKSIRIGKVTRLMKTIAVDCNLNISQTNFTAEKLMSMAENRNIRQTLSDKSQIIFRVGDQPFTDICDYMEECDFKCSSQISQSDLNNEKKINKSSYLEQFAISNKQTIAQRIRDAFRDKHVYSREQLVKILNTPRSNPPEQIFSVLSLFIQSKGHGIGYLVDKYGRTGYLVNRGDKYAFQPMEIVDTSIGIWERETPVLYSREAITLEIPKEIDKTAVMKFDKHNITNQEPIKETEINESEEIAGYSNLLEYLGKQYSKTLFTKEIPQGNKDWYDHISNLRSILTGSHGITSEKINQYIVYHILDTLSYTDKLILLNHLYNSETNHEEKGEDLEEIANKMKLYTKKYFDEKIMKSDVDPNMIGISLCGRGNLPKLYVKSKEDIDWKETIDEDYTLFREAIYQSIIPENKWFRLIGFMSEFKEKDVVFKTKYIGLTVKNKGARCDSAGKSDIIKKINELVGSTQYTAENTANIMLTGMCGLLELLMRHYTELGKNGKVYFFNAEEAAMFQITEK